LKRGIRNDETQFGMYIMFPIAIMYYYGTNLDNRFSVPDFWPKPEQTNRIPFERDEIKSELERLKQRRLYLREKRLERDGGGSNEGNGM
jgi:protein PET100, fungi type